MMRALMAINTVAWQPFFTTTGGATATLAGLLFVSLSLNRDKLSAPENKLMLRLAQRCFSDYLYVLVICLCFLIPDQGDHALALELSLLGVGRVRRLFRHARDTTHDLSRHLLEWKTLQKYALHVVCSVGLVVISIFVYTGKEIAPYLVVPVVIMLVGNASWDAWLLLVMEKDFAKRA